MPDDEVDFYAVLELATDADDTTIRLAYRRLARRYHPDIAGEESLRLMQLLNQAYQTLSNPERRRVYDASRPNHTPASPPAPHAPPPPRPPAREARPAPTTSASAGPLRRIAALDDGEMSAIVSVALAQGGAVVATGHIDGQIMVWDVAHDHIAARLALGSPGQPGTLSELRIASDGTLVAAWGFALGLGVWRVGEDAPRWSSRMNAPAGLMDAAFLAHPAGLLRLALPDAPPALADDDPFRWADTGRRGTALYTRPLPASGPINPAWAIPLRCPETPARRYAGPDMTPWQVRERVLSADGQRLLTFSTGEPDGRPRSQVIRLWDLEARSRRGAAEPRRIAEMTEPDGLLTFPLAATPNLARVALAESLGQMRLLSPDGRVRQRIATGPLPLDAFAALTPDAAMLAIAHGQRLDLWQTASGQPLQHWRLPAPLTALAFAHTPRPLLAIGLANGLTELWG
jgi:hypothetical protein